MKNSLRIGITVVVLVALGLLAAWVGHRVLLHRLTRTAVASVAGFGIEYDDVNLGLLNSTVSMEGLRILNPEEYPEPLAFEFREVYVDFRWLALFQDPLHVQEVRLDIARLVVVRTMQGESNLERLLEDAPEAGTYGAPAEPEGPPGKAQPAVPEVGQPEPASSGPADEQEPAVEAVRERGVLIDRLWMRIGEVAVRDYSSGGPQPSVFNMTVNREVVLENVSDLDAVAEQIEDAVFADTLGNLGGLSRQALGRMDDLVNSQVGELDLSEEARGDINTILKSLAGEDVAVEGLDEETQREIEGMAEAALGVVEQQFGMSRDEILDTVGGMLEALSDGEADDAVQ